MAISPQNSAKKAHIAISDPAYVIGGGPSLRNFDFEQLRGRPCYAANKGAFFAPWAELVSIDRDFCWNFAKEIQAFGDRAHLAPPDPMKDKIPGAVYYRRDRHENPFTCGPDVLPGLNSGFAALARAIQKGHKKIALLGIDMIPNQGHFHSGYAWNPNQIDGIIRAWIDQFNSLAADCRAHGVTVINFSPASGVTGFPKMPLDQLFCATFEEKDASP